MGKGSYYGGSTIFGPPGKATKIKQFRGGRDVIAAAERRREKRKAEKAEVEAKIRQNEKLIKKLSKEWQDEKGKAAYQRLVKERYEKSSSLAAAMKKAGLF